MPVRAHRQAEPAFGDGHALDDGFRGEIEDGDEMLGVAVAHHERMLAAGYRYELERQPAQRDLPPRRRQRPAVGHHHTLVRARGVTAGAQRQQDGAKDAEVFGVFHLVPCWLSGWSGAAVVHDCIPTDCSHAQAASPAGTEHRHSKRSRHPRGLARRRPGTSTLTGSPPRNALRGTGPRRGVGLPSGTGILPVNPPPPKPHGRDARATRRRGGYARLGKPRPPG